MADEVKVRGAGTRIANLNVYGLSGEQTARAMAIELALMSVGTISVNLNETGTKSLIDRAKGFEAYIMGKG